MSAFKTKVVHGVTLRADPAREPCFNVVQNAEDLADYADMSAVARRQRLHKHMHNEMQSLEMAAQSLADFPDAPWDLRMGLARQCWDESRHTRLLHRRLLEIGGRKGEFPVMNFEWSITCMAKSIWARLAIQNRTFEGTEMDLLRRVAQMWREAGDDVTAELIEGILADEIQHVRYVNTWFKRMSNENPAVLLQLALGVDFARKVMKAFEPEPNTVNAVGVNLTAFDHVDLLANVDDRRLAGFSEADIEHILREEEALRVSSARARAAASSDVS